jgi:response regulator RpfG family c-di-GMP phosphodiesterase
MSQLEENARTKGGIMVVDDNPANLKLLEDMLRQKGYQVRSFSRGRLALTSAAKNPPDLILLDVSMPEMSGYEVCEQVRAIEDFPGIPVLFISAMDRTEDKISGFRAGGVDYIAKPFQFEEVHARVETHLKLRRAQKAEQQLLELTLNGAIRMLADMVQSNSPELAVRSRAIRDCVAWITHRMGVSEPWQYDLAATLCLIGCVTLPEEVFKRGYAGEINSAEDEAMFRGHPESAAHLLTNLPRLEPIAEMIRLQQGPGSADQSAASEIKFGALILFLAIELDRRLYRGVDFRTALREIKKMQEGLDPAISAALDAYSPARSDFHREALPIKKLFPGMVLEEDVIGELTKVLIQRKGTVLTGTWIERLENFARSQGIKEPLPVLVPGHASVPAFEGRPRRMAERESAIKT